MKAIWIDDGQEADPNLLRRHGIQEAYYPAKEANVTAALCQKTFDQGFQVGLYFAWNWYPGLSGAALADKIDAEMKRIGWNGNPAVCVDIEKGAGLTAANYVDYVVAFMIRWRIIRPTRKTDWTLEGLQGGLFNRRAPAVDVIRRANVGIIPQHYTGEMDPIAADSNLHDLLSYGFPEPKILGFYDAATLPLEWNGYAFTQGRLP